MSPRSVGYAKVSESGDPSPATCIVRIPGFLSLSIALVFGHFTNLWAWTYFVFIVTLFTFRQLDDDRHCAEKYGAEKWAEYKARVKYRIFPGVY